MAENENILYTWLKDYVLEKNLTPPDETRRIMLKIQLRALIAITYMDVDFDLNNEQISDVLEKLLDNLTNLETKKNTQI